MESLINNCYHYIDTMTQVYYMPEGRFFDREKIQKSKEFLGENDILQSQGRAHIYTTKGVRYLGESDNPKIKVLFSPSDVYPGEVEQVTFETRPKKLNELDEEELKILKGLEKLLEPKQVLDIIGRPLDIISI